ncbi:Mastermind-like protein 1 [Acipenser ruthenus]|uniref:Mastermind-like protein 1 n=1 Tax=Acipenser ruthenus TaxID=7906 RepID=A0A444UV43_ACIRT|nr:Mastermind-like protein 1 [Acipenser ruthenus]
MAEQEKQRHQQEQQLQRHLTRPPPQYQDQQQNPYQQQQQEKQRHQQEQQLQRHLTRPPPQYQDQQQNPYQQQQQVNHFQGTGKLRHLFSITFRASSQGLVNMGNLGAQSASNQRMFSQSQGMMQMGRGQAGAPSSADPTASQPELDMPAYNSMDNVQPVMYNNMGAANQLHPHVAQQSAMSDAQLQRQPVRMGQSSTVPTGYRQNLMGSSGLTTQQLHKGPANQALIKQQQMARMPNAMGAQAQSWQHQGMQSMNNQTPGGANNGLGVFNNTGFHMQQQPPKMANQQFSQAGLNVNRPMAAMNSAVAGQMMPTLAQQRTNQPPPQQQQPQQPVVSGMNQPMPDLTNFGQAQNPQMVNRAILHCSQGYQKFNYKVNYVGSDGVCGCCNGVRRNGARVNCAEYFPLFVSMLWVASLYFSQVVAPLCGLLYLYGRYQYFHGYAQSSQGRLAPMYFSARVLWLLIGFSTVGVLSDLSKIYFGVAFLQGLKVFLRSYWIPF